MIYLNSFGQNLYLKIIGESVTTTKIFDSIGYRKIHENAKSFELPNIENIENEEDLIKINKNIRNLIEQIKMKLECLKKESILLICQI